MPAGRRTICFIAADPSTESRLRLGEEYRVVQEKLRSSKYRDRFLLQSETSVRIPDLTRIILEESPWILHFAGHGVRGSGSLCFESENGGVQAVTTKALGKFVFPG
jgi:hypothetical protein